MIPKFLQPERVLFASLEIVRAKIAAHAPTPVSDVERTIEETQRDAFHTFLTDPATGPKLDAALADNATVDAKLKLAPAPLCHWCPDFNLSTQEPGMSHGICADCADRLAREDEDAGSRCSARCGWCGGCS